MEKTFKIAERQVVAVDVPHDDPDWLPLLCAISRRNCIAAFCLDESKAKGEEEK